jgi:hypothetical protein
MHFYASANDDISPLQTRQGGSRACLSGHPAERIAGPHASKRRSEAAPKLHAVTKGQQNKAAGKSTADRKLPQTGS